MKTKKIELDVDFIGGHGSLTVAEEKALSEFFKNHQSDSKQTVDNKKTKPKKRSKITA